MNAHPDAHYQESGDAANAYRQAYRGSVDRLVERLRAESAAKRDAYMARVHAEPERYRADLRAMLGWPLAEADALPLLSSRVTHVATDDLSRIHRVELEVLPGIWTYGLWLENALPGPERRPAILFQHGGQGTPEVCCGLLNSGNYNGAVRRILARGAHVFAPQLLLWRQPEFGADPYDRPQIDRALKQLGSSLAAFELFVMRKAVDFCAASPLVDVNRLGVAGLSYGGFYALFAGALDTRLRATLSSCFVNDRLRYGWPDWVWNNAANTFLDAEVGALICPRALYVEAADHDELFDADGARAEFERLAAYYAPRPDRLRTRVFSGIHEFAPDEEGIDFLMGNLG